MTKILINKKIILKIKLIKVISVRKNKVISKLILMYKIKISFLDTNLKLIRNLRLIISRINLF